MATNNDAPHKPVRLHFRFENFNSLSSCPGFFVDSDVQTDKNGNEWYLELYPGGEIIEYYSDDEESDDTIGDGEDGNDDRDNNAEDFDDNGVAAEHGDIDRNDAVEEECVSSSIYVRSKSSKFSKSAFKVDVHVLDKDGSIACERSYQYGIYFYTWTSIRNEGTDFLIRSLMKERDILHDGALCIDVTIQVLDTADQLHQISNQHATRMLKLLESGEKADASFIIGDKTFNVHSPIIHANAPMLSDFLDQQDASAVIKDIHPEVFHIILKHIYTGVLPEMDKYCHAYMSEKMFDYGMELIDAANRFELIEMKIAVENVLVGERILTRKNVSDYILFAHAQSCPLLKEYAISYFMLHAREILQSEHSKRLRESAELLSEIIMLQHSPPNGDCSVTELRKGLIALGADIDGSKEVLAKRFKNVLTTGNE